MADPVRRDARGTALDYEADRSEGEHKDTLAGERKTFTAGKAGSGKDEIEDSKQHPDESLSAFSTRMRLARDVKRNAPAKAAIKERIREIRAR